MPIGLSVMDFVIIALVLMGLFGASVILGNIRFYRPSPAEVSLLMMFSSTVSLLVGLLVGGAYLYAIFVFVLMIVFSVLLFVSRIRGLILKREERRLMRKESYGADEEVMRRFGSEKK